MDHTLNPELAYAAWRAAEEATWQKNIVVARDYYDGYQNTKLTERQKEFLGFNLTDERFAFNYCATVVNAIVERMLVSGFTSATDETFTGWVWDIWQTNRMDALQRSTHQGAVLDGEYFIIVDWDDDTGMPRFSLHPRYTDPVVDGTGFGCKAFYPDDDPTQPMVRASKRWTETIVNEGGKLTTSRRMTVYLPDHIKKYIAGHADDDSGWIKLIEEGQPWPLPWVDNAGEPLGIPVIHFRNPGRRTELWDAMPIQDAINKTALDILAVADASGFPIRFSYGFYATTDGKAPEEDGSNYLKLSPGAWVGIPQTEARTENLEPADLGPMLLTLDSLIVKLAQVTDTPTSRFQVTRQIAAEGTLKQQEGPLLAKVRARQVLFGNAWENAFYMARRLANHLASAGLNEDALLETQWHPAETRDEKEHIETIGLKVEKLEIPLEQAWSEAGYSKEDIDRMRAQRGEQMAQTSNIGGALLEAFERGT